MEHFLGTLAFAKSLNRTLILPPFVEYHPGKPHAVLVDFDKYFLVEPLRDFHSVNVMRDFMKDMAPNIWPVDKRKAFCWQPRRSIYGASNSYGCHAKEGNPFGPFWDYSNISFVGDIYYAADFPGAHDISSVDFKENWDRRFPVSRYPVLSFISAPAPFPAQNSVHHLHKYIHWSNTVLVEANKYVSETLKRPFMGIHLRNDVDWENVCRLIRENETQKLFGSSVCTGDHGKLTKEMCLPSLETILKNVVEKVSELNIRSVFVSSDRNHYIKELNEKLSMLQVTVHRRYPENLHINLAILSGADHFIGNCVSTLSSFIYRQRKYASNVSRTSFFASNSFTDVKEEL